MLITALYLTLSYLRPKGCREPRNEVAFQSPDERISKVITTQSQYFAFGPGTGIYETNIRQNADILLVSNIGRDGLISKIWTQPEAYSEPCEASKMELFAT